MKDVKVPPAEMDAYLADKPEALRVHYAMVLRQGERNRVLNQMRSGLGAMNVGENKVAAESFDQAILGIETVYANNDAASKARSKFVQESYKDYKGEPYERAMAYYYRGLLYMYEGDYENARASFKNGMLQDAFAEDEQNAADFALMAMLEGWASQCVANDPDAHQRAAERYDEAIKIKAEMPRPAREHNTLLIAETGTAPVKQVDGKYKHIMKYRRGDGFDEAKVRFAVGEPALNAFSIEDIYFQASTRGGRPVDAINEGKVQFKEGTGTAAKVLAVTGAAAATAALMSNSRELGIAGAGLLIGALVIQGISEATRPQADDRSWDNLPDGVHFATLTLPATEQRSVRVEFLTSDDTPVETLTKSVKVEFAGKCAVAWVRSRSAVPASASPPGVR